MDIFKIVFTGGPCAGKTTQINMVKKYLEDKGYTVMCVSETATDLYNLGLKYKFINNQIDFQTLVLKAQSFKENLLDENIQNKSEKIVVLYDRGILDNKAYFDNLRDFDYILKQSNLKEINILDNYDLVIDLVSLAACDPKKYEIDSNDARTETVDYAKKLDERTSNVWAGHHNFSIFNSNTSIKE